MTKKTEKPESNRFADTLKKLGGKELTRRVSEFKDKLNDFMMAGLAGDPKAEGEVENVVPRVIAICDLAQELIERSGRDELMVLRRILAKLSEGRRMADVPGDLKEFLKMLGVPEKEIEAAMAAMVGGDRTPGAPVVIPMTLTKEDAERFGLAGDYMSGVEDSAADIKEVEELVTGQKK